MENQGINFKLSADTGNLIVGIKKAEEFMKGLSISSARVSTTAKTAEGGRD